MNVLVIIGGACWCPATDDGDAGESSEHHVRTRHLCCGNRCKQSHSMREIYLNSDLVNMLVACNWTSKRTFIYFIPLLILLHIFLCLFGIGVCAEACWIMGTAEFFHRSLVWFLAWRAWCFVSNMAMIRVKIIILLVMNDNKTNTIVTQRISIQMQIKHSRSHCTLTSYTRMRTHCSNPFNQITLTLGHDNGIDTMRYL